MQGGEGGKCAGGGKCAHHTAFSFSQGALFTVRQGEWSGRYLRLPRLIIDTTPHQQPIVRCNSVNPEALALRLLLLLQ
jgi:hypothetical protein